MRMLLSKETTIKLFAILSAILLWFYVTNVQNPNENSVITNIAINKINMNSLSDNGFVIKDDKNYTVSVYIEGRRKDVMNVSKKDFEIEADYSRINKTGLTVLPLEIPKYLGAHNITVKRFEPTSIHVEVGKADPNEFSVELQTNGTPLNGYQIIEKDINPKVVTLKNSEAQGLKADSVKVVADVSGISKNFRGQLRCKVFDRRGREIPELSEGLPNIDVDIRVAKEVAVSANLQGQPASEYYVADIKVRPEYVLVAGDENKISDIEKIDIGPIDIEGITKTVEEVVAIDRLPEGVYIVNEIQPPLVLVEIKPLDTKPIKLGANIEVINANQLFTYEVLTSDVGIFIMGHPDVIKRITDREIEAFIDVGGLKEGNHTLKIDYYLPNGVFPKEDYFAEVRILKK